MMEPKPIGNIFDLKVDLDSLIKDFMLTIFATSWTNYSSPLFLIVVS